MSKKRTPPCPMDSQEAFPMPCTCANKARHAARTQIIGMARKQYEREGELEIDDDINVKLSESEDNGCYVSAWLWVDFTDTPLSKEPR